MTARALILGASGLVGSTLLKELLKQDSIYDEVIAPTRRPLSLFDTKLSNPVFAMDQWRDNEHSFPKADDIFYCIGTTKKKAGGPGAFVHIERGLAFDLLSLAKKNGAKNVYLISSIGADARSFFIYPKIKGEIEDYTRFLGFNRSIIFRPSLLIGERDSERPLEKMTGVLLEGLAKMTGDVFGKFRPIEAVKLAKVIYWTAGQSGIGLQVIDNEKIHRRVKKITQPQYNY